MDTIARIFTHVSAPVNTPKYEAIRKAALDFARVIEENAPNCGDRFQAITHIREAVFFANAAIALEGLV